MDFDVHRPHRHPGRSERALVNIAQDLARFLTQAQRPLREKVTERLLIDQ